MNIKPVISKKDYRFGEALVILLIKGGWIMGVIHNLK